MIALKGRFKTIQNTMFGLFIIQINEHGNFIENYAIICNRDNSTYNHSPEKNGWKVFHDEIQSLKLRGNIVQTVSSDLTAKLKNAISDDNFYKGLSSYVASKSNEKIQALLRSLYYRSITDREDELIVDFEIESYEPEEDLADDDLDINDEPEIDDGIFLSIDCVVSPVKGKYIIQLKVGDKLMVKINPSDPRSQYFIDLLNLREENLIHPTPAEIIKYTKRDADFEITVKIGEGIYGKIFEAEKVKIRMYDPVIDKLRKNTDESAAAAKGKKIPETIKVQESNLINYLLIGAGLIFLIVIFTIISMD